MGFSRQMAVKGRNFYKVWIGLLLKTFRGTETLFAGDAIKNWILICICIKQRHINFNTNIRDKQIKSQNFDIRFVVIVIKSTCNEPRWDYFAPLNYLSSQGKGKVKVRVDMVSHGPARQCIGIGLLFYLFLAEI